MQRSVRTMLFLMLGASTVTALTVTIATGDPPAPPATSSPAATGAPAEAISVDEARGRARLLHETVHATLQIVHHEYYREDEGLTIPAATLSRMFDEMKTRQKVGLRWLAVNAQAMNVDHRPRDAFEKEAVAALSAGQTEYEAVDKDAFRFAGAITLTSDCLKCHSPTRTSNKDRAAGVVITIPMTPAAGK